MFFYSFALLWDGTFPWAEFTPVLDFLSAANTTYLLFPNYPLSHRCLRRSRGRTAFQFTFHRTGLPAAVVDSSVPAMLVCVRATPAVCVTCCFPRFIFFSLLDHLASAFAFWRARSPFARLPRAVGGRTAATLTDARASLLLH